MNKLYFVKEINEIITELDLSSMEKDLDREREGHTFDIQRKYTIQELVHIDMQGNSCSIYAKDFKVIGNR